MTEITARRVISTAVLSLGFLSEGLICRNFLLCNHSSINYSYSITRVGKSSNLFCFIIFSTFSSSLLLLGFISCFAIFFSLLPTYLLLQLPNNLFITTVSSWLTLASTKSAREPALLSAAQLTVNNDPPIVNPASITSSHSIYTNKKINYKNIFLL